MPSKKITIRGDTFRSAIVASQVTGYSLSAIYKARQRGTLDNLGGSRGPKPYPVKVRGTLYNSPMECAIGENVTVKHVYKMIQLERYDSIGIGKKRAKLKNGHKQV